MSYVSLLAGHSTAPLLILSIMSPGLVLIYIVAQRQSSAQNLLSSAECFLAKEWCCVCWAVLTISSNVMFSLCLMFFCFFPFLDDFSRALVTREKTESMTLILACSEQSVSLRPQTFLITCCFENIITRLS